jgi:hypothetical protein
VKPQIDYDVPVVYGAVNDPGDLKKDAVVICVEL